MEAADELQIDDLSRDIEGRLQRYNVIIISLIFSGRSLVFRTFVDGFAGLCLLFCKKLERTPTPNTHNRQQLNNLTENNANYVL